MSWWRNLSDLFSGVAPGVSGMSLEAFEAEDKLIGYLIGFVARDDLIGHERQQYAQIRTLTSRQEKELAYAKLYLALENFIVSNKPLVTKREFKNKQELRTQVAEHVGLAALSLPVQLIFFSEAQKAIALAALSLSEALGYIRKNMGDKEAQSIFNEVVRGSELETVFTVDSTISLEAVSVTLAKLSLSPTEVRVHLVRMYGALLEKMTKTFGEKAVGQVTEGMYDLIAQSYDRELIGLFLENIPEGILEPQKLLSLSRTALEKKVLEATVALRMEKESVERKVVERTSQLKQKVEELNLANERLRELDKVKTEFISVAAHQLRTPLSAVKWTFSILMDGTGDTNLTPEQRDLLLKGYTSNERMISLVDELLVVTRIESKQMSLTFSSVQLEPLIEIALRDFQAQAQARGIALVFEKSPTSLPLVTADADKLKSVIQNLVNNAFSYTNDGGRITVTAEVEGAAVRISVTDTGIGIPSAQQSSIFNKFFRADNAAGVKTDGSGLGLFIAKSIIEKHGGTIGFESSEGKGSAFHFTIPVLGTTSHASISLTPPSSNP